MRDGFGAPVAAYSRSFNGRKYEVQLFTSNKVGAINVVATCAWEDQEGKEIIANNTSMQTVSLSSAPSARRCIVHIDTFKIDRHHQRDSYVRDHVASLPRHGSHLLLVLAELYFAHGCEAFVVTNPTPQGVSFYRKCGFTSMMNEYDVARNLTFPLRNAHALAAALMAESDEDMHNENEAVQAQSDPMHPALRLFDDAVSNGARAARDQSLLVREHTKPPGLNVSSPPPIPNIRPRVHPERQYNAVNRKRKQAEMVRPSKYARTLSEDAIAQMQTYRCMCKRKCWINLEDVWYRKAIVDARGENYAMSQQSLTEHVSSMLRVMVDAHGNMNYSFLNNRVCKNMFIFIHGISQWKLDQAWKLFRHRSLFTVHGMTGRWKQSKKDWVYAELWVYFDEICDTQVDGKMHLPNFLTNEDLVAHLKQIWTQLDSQERPPGDPNPPSIQVVRKVRKKYFKHVRSPKLGDWGACYVCITLGEKRKRGFISVEAREEYLKQTKTHSFIHKTVRRGQQLRARYARNNREKVIFLYWDYTRAVKIPAFHPKIFDSRSKKPISIEWALCLDMGTGKKYFVLHTGNIGKDANTIITVAYCIIRALLTDASAPYISASTFFAQFDGGSENANYPMLAFCDILNKFWFHKVQSDRMLPSHTHGPVDRPFGAPRKKLSLKTVTNIPLALATMASGNSPEEQAEYIIVDKTLDWTSWFTPSKPSALKHYTQALAFRWKRDSRTQGMRYKTWGECEKDWMGYNGLTTGRHLRTMTHVPAGKPSTIDNGNIWVGPSHTQMLAMVADSIELHAAEHLHSVLKTGKIPVTVTGGLEDGKVGNPGHVQCIQEDGSLLRFSVRVIRDFPADLWALPAFRDDALRHRFLNSQR